MKKVFLITAILLASLRVFSQNPQDISREEAWKIVQTEVLKGDLENVNVFVSAAVLISDSWIRTLYQDEKSPAFDAWFFFIDDRPFASWSHPCRYVF